MACEQAVLRRLYRCLLGLYPRPFRQQLGESMQQTFNDLYKARKHQPAPGRLVFVLGLFAETAIGVAHEHGRSIRSQGVQTAMRLRAIPAASAAGLVLVLPFVVLEYLSNIRSRPGALHSGYLADLTFLFGMLWLLPTVFFSLLIPLVRGVRAGDAVLARPVVLSLRIAALVLVAWLWSSLLLDQLPCFLGVPNCD